MAAGIYGLCALTALTCSFLLMRSYLATRVRLLFWSGMCFGGMFINNLLLIFDRLVFPETDLSTLRLLSALIAVCCLLYGLVWEGE